MRFSAKAVAAAAACALLLSACSDSDAEETTTSSDTPAAAITASGDPTTDESTSADATDEPTGPPEVTVSDEGMPSLDDSGDAPRLTFDSAEPPTDLRVSVVEEGEGRTLTDTDRVIVDYVGQVWGSSEPFDSSYGRGTSTSFSLTEVVPGWRFGLADQKVGSKVIVSVPAEFGYGPSGGNPQAGIGPEDTIAFYVEIHDGFAPDAWGDPNAEPATDEAAPGGYPVTVEGALGEAPSITVEDGAEAPTEPDAVVLAEGSGNVIEGASSEVYVQYAATTWDNSASESSPDFGGVMPVGVQEGSPFAVLEGLPAGSRVLVIIPGNGPDVLPLAAVVDIIAVINSAAE